MAAECRQAGPDRLGMFQSFCGFSKSSKKMIMAGILEAVGNTFMWFLFVLYLQHLGFSKPALGFAITIKLLSNTLPLLPSGYLGDRFGRKRVAILGLSILFFGLLGFVLAEKHVYIYLATAIWGAGHAIYAPAFMVFLSEKTSDERRKYLFSLISFSVMISGAVATLAAGFMPNMFTARFGIPLTQAYKTVFLIGSLFIILAITRLLFVPKTKRVEDERKKQEKAGKSLIPKKTLALLAVPMIFLGFGAGLIVPFFQVYFIWRFDTPIETISMLFALTHFLWGVGYLFMPRFADRVGSVKAITTVHILAIFALIMMPLSTSFYMLAAMYVMRMVLMNSTWPILQSFTLGLVPNEHRNLALGSLNFSFNLPKGISPAYAGYMFERDLDQPFFICAILYAWATIFFFLFFRRKDDRKEAKT